MSLWDVANQQLKGLVAYEPGRPIEEVARDLGLERTNLYRKLKALGLTELVEALY